MGNDYQLKKIYEQMLNNSVEPSEDKQPRSLKEAYEKKLITERVAFYTKDIGDAQISPDISGLENLGIVEKPDKIKHIIGSQSVKPALNELMQAAGKWQSLDGYEASYLDPIAAAFVACGVTSNMVTKIIKKKKDLNSVERQIANQTIFNTSNEVVKDLEAYIASSESSENSSVDFGRLYQHIFNQKGKIADVGVGYGEIALTLFTNCIKGKVGDLDTPSIGAVEIKTDMGRIAKKSQVNLKFSSDLANFLQTNEAKQSTSSEISKIKYSISLNIDDIKETTEFKNTFTEQFVKLLDQLVNSIGTNEFHKLYSKSIFASKIPNQGKTKENVVYQLYKDLGYVVSENETTPPPSNITLNYIYNEHKKIKSIFAKEDNLKIGKYETVVSNNNVAKDVSKMTSYNALQHLFQTDYNFTPEQLTNGLMLIVGEGEREKAKEFAPFFLEFFNPSGKYAKHVRALRSGNLKVLQGLVFALQASLYGKGHFNYLFVVNKTSYEGIGFDVTSPSGMYDTFITNQERLLLGFTLDDRGGSQITLR